MSLHPFIKLICGQKDLVKGKIFPGLAVTGMFSKIISMYLPGKNCVIMDINFA